MTTKKLSLTITSLTLLICILFSGVLYSISKSVVGSNFKNDTGTVVQNIYSDIFGENNNFGDITPNECARIVCDNQIKWLPYTDNLQYPFTFAIYDSAGNRVEEYGYYILTDDEYINIDEYINDDIINKFKSAFDDNGTGVAIDSFSYYEKDGKKTVTKMTFYNFITDKTLDVTLNDYKGKTITKTNVNRFDEENSTSINFDFSKMYQNRRNKKIQNRIDKLVKDQRQMSDEGLNGNGGYSGPEASQQSYTFGNSDNKYTVYLISTYDTFYCATHSTVFQYGIEFIAIIFICMSIILSLVACKIFNKQKELNNARQAFTSGAAHELKTPITIINNQCECLIKKVSPEKNDEYISAIYRQNKHMANLVGKLLQYNRITKDTLNKTKFDIKELVEEEIEKYKLLADEHDVNIDTDLESKTINADRDLIVLVVDNFISNAIKNTNGGDKIRISFSADRLSVFNEGKPIDNETGSKIWEVFTRSTDNDVIESHGMGLATCKKILDLHKFKYGYINKSTGVEFYFEVRQKNGLT